MTATAQSVQGQNKILHQHIVSLLNLDVLPESQRAMLLDKMADVINGRLLLRLWEGFDSGLRREFSAAMDSENNAALENFLLKRVPNFIDVLSEEVLKLKKEMMAHLRA